MKLTAFNWDRPTVCVYLTILSTAHNLNTKDEYEELIEKYKEIIFWPNIWYCSGICLEGLR